MPCQPSSECSFEEVYLKILQAAGGGAILQDLLVGIVQHLGLEVLHQLRFVLKRHDLGLVDHHHPDQQRVDHYLPV